MKNTALFSKHFFILALFYVSIPMYSKLVPAEKALNAASNFFAFATGIKSELKIQMTEADINGDPLYYVFSVKNAKGFVIASADDAANPIIGYSQEDVFEKPLPSSNYGSFLKSRAREISYIRSNAIPADARIASQWERYSKEIKIAGKTNAIVVQPLLTTRWNQSPFINDSCPGGSVTGCVATAMAQIMKFWSYPLQGTGSSSYCDCTNQGFSNNYGTLKANYGSSTYNWASMPDLVTSPNAEVARINYHCGVSVEMDYSPEGSGAMVIEADYPVCAENAYKTYFKYNSVTLQGLHRNMYTDAQWKSKMRNDLDIGRPMQYVGFGNAGGHTWVCDGYDDANMFHMNWGWGGTGNGFYSIDNLNPAGMDFNGGQECIFGIVPIASQNLDAGVVSLSKAAGNSCSVDHYSPIFKMRNYGISNLTSCMVNYQFDNNPQQVINWTGNLVTGQLATIALGNFTLSPGSHTLNVLLAGPNNGMDGFSGNNQLTYQFEVYSTGVMPLVQGFEDVNQFSSDWVIRNFPSGNNWSITSSAFSGGEKSLMIDNYGNTPGHTSILQGLMNYDMYQFSEPYVYFKVAYQQITAADNDKLSLEISNDCGNSWWTRWSKQGNELASSAQLSNTPYVPSASEFVSYLVPAAISSNVVFRFVFRSSDNAPGNNIYLDDINIVDQAVGIKENTEFTNVFGMYPNPSGGEVTVKIKLRPNSDVKLDVMDVSGRQLMNVFRGRTTGTEQIIRFNSDRKLQKGIYLMSAEVDGAKYTGKLVITE